MDIIKKSLKLGIGLGLLTLALFFILFIIFSTNGNVSDEEYFNYSMGINSFLLPFLYAGTAFYMVYQAAKREPLDFRTAFKIGFTPLFIAGLLSITGIFFFFNTAGEWAQASLQRGMFDGVLKKATAENLELMGDQLNQMREMKINMFSLRIYFSFLATMLVFYMVIAAIFAMFLRKRRI